MKTIDTLLKEYEQSIYKTVASGGIAPRWVIKHRVQTTLLAICNRDYNLDITVRSSLYGVGTIRIGNPENRRLITIDISFYDTEFTAISTSGSKHKLRDLESALAWVLGETETTEPEEEREDKKESWDTLLKEHERTILRPRYNEESLDTLLKEYEQSILRARWNGGTEPKGLIRDYVQHLLRFLCKDGYDFDITIDTALDGSCNIRVGNPKNGRAFAIEVLENDIKYMAETTAFKGLQNAIEWVTEEVEALEPDEDSILLEAQELVFGERAEQYGDPAKSFEYIAKMWSTVLKTEVEPYQVAQCMIGLKLARVSASPGLRDSWVDIAGYACLGEMMAPKEEKE